MFDNLTVEEFLNKVSSNDPVPGGGSVSALAGSLAASLAAMVASLTIGKKKYIEVEEEMKEIKEQALKLKEKLYEDIKKDSESFEEVMKAFKLPKATDEEKVHRKNVIEDATKKAALVPFDAAKTACEVISLAEKVIEKGNKNAVTDGAVAAMLARTAVFGALYNTKINLGGIEDSVFVEDLKEKVISLEKEALEKEKVALSKVIL